MIIGFGSDITDIRRIEKLIIKFETRFVNRCFTEIEIEKAEQRRNAGMRINTYAKRFAAKEACAKALGTGFNNGVFMKDICVINSTSGASTLTLTGGALKRLQEITPNGKNSVLHLSITDEPPIAQAQVIIEAL